MSDSTIPLDGFLPKDAPSEVTTKFLPGKGQRRRRNRRRERKREIGVREGRKRKS